MGQCSVIAARPFCTSLSKVQVYWLPLNIGATQRIYCMILWTRLASPFLLSFLLLSFLFFFFATRILSSCHLLLLVLFIWLPRKGGLPERFAWWLFYFPI